MGVGAELTYTKIEAVYSELDKMLEKVKTWSEIERLNEKLAAKLWKIGNEHGEDGKVWFKVTSEALVWLLDKLIFEQDVKRFLNSAVSLLSLDKEEVDIRKYQNGDFFRDISLRHSLRQIVKQRKHLEEVGRKDLMVRERKSKSKMDIALCVDVSCSMKEQSKLRLAKLAAAGLLKACLQKGHRVSLVTFNHSAQILTSLTDKFEPFLSLLVRLKAESFTNLSEGIKCARKLLEDESRSSPKQIILITDGQANAVSHKVATLPDLKKRENLGVANALQEAKRAASKNIKISVFTITSGDEWGERVGKKIANIGSGQFYKATTKIRF
jgi:Mg-chelatase subunit ChlD